MPTSQTLVVDPICLVLGLRRRLLWYPVQRLCAMTAIHPPSDAFLVPQSARYEQPTDPNDAKERRWKKGKTGTAREWSH